MFFIILLLILTLITVLVFAFKIKAVIKADNNNISIGVRYLFIRLGRKYVIKYEESTLLTLYQITKKGLEKITTFPEIVSKITKTAPADITFNDLITALTRSFRKKEKGLFYYIYKRININVEAAIRLGLEDALLTAIGCGLVNASAGTACAVYNTKKQIFRFKAYPEFSKLFFSINADCIIALAPADIIIGYAIYKKNKRR